MWSFCSSVNHGCDSLSDWNSQRKDEEGVVGKKKKCLSSSICLFHPGQQLKYELQLSKWIHKTYPNISHLMGVCLLTWHSALPLFSISRNGCGKSFKKWTRTIGKMEQHSLGFFKFIYFFFFLKKCRVKKLERMQRKWPTHFHLSDMTQWRMWESGSRRLLPGLKKQRRTNCPREWHRAPKYSLLVWTFCPN